MSSMNFWDNHAALRVLLIAVCFVAGMLGIFGGLSVKGTLLGIAIMLLGLAALLAALWIYNAPFADKK